MFMNMKIVNAARGTLMAVASKGALIMASAFVLGASALATAGTLNDAQILGIYIQVNGFDVETALLGQSHAKSDAVRALAGHVASDHVGVRQAAFDLAQKCGVSPSLPEARNDAAIEHGKAMARLMEFRGADFDKAYLEHEIAFHTGAIEAVSSLLLPSATCPALQAHFKAILPAFEHHLSQTKEIGGKIANR